MELDRRFTHAFFHLLFVVPLFLYVGYVRANTPKWLYMGLFGIGALILIYHGYRLVHRLAIRSGYSWVNIMHILIVAPILLLIGYHKREAPRYLYELLLMLGFGAGGYHLMSLIRALDTHPEPSK